MPKKPVTVNRAHEAERLGAKLVREVPQHAHLAGARVLYLFTSKRMTGKGRVALAKVGLTDPVTRYLSADPDDAPDGYDALVLVNAATWPALTPEQREALIDHELCHLVRDEDGVLGLVGHDLEEFASVVQRHGLWMTDVRLFAKAIEQATLFDEAPRELAAV